MHTERVFLACVYFLLAAHGDTRTGNRCIEGLSRTFTIQLQCSVGEWIHVEQEAYGDGDAATCRLKNAESCSKVYNSSQNGLVVNCNGEQSCREAMSASTLTCNVTDAAADVKYNCIKGSMYMCSSVSTTVNGSVYLHSLGFPDSVGVNGSCLVRITGQNIRVTMVDERMKAGLLNISGDGKQLWTSVNRNQYNRLLPGTAAEIVIVYDNLNQNGSDVWIRVSASGQMNITSERQPLEASTTPVPSPTQAPSRSQGTTSPSTLDTLTTTAATASTPLTSVGSLTMSIATTLRISNVITKLSERTTSTTAQGSTDTMTSLTSTALSSTHTDNGSIVLPFAVVCGIMGLIIVALIIYIMVNKVSRNSHGNSSNIETSVHYGVQSIPNGPQGEDDLIPTSGTTNTYSGLSHDVERNIYTGIQRNASEDGDEHSYGHINRSEGPSYVNSVSGDNPYINA